MKKIKVLFLFLFIYSNFIGYAQTDTSMSKTPIGIPTSFMNPSILASEPKLPAVVLPALNNTLLQAKADSLDSCSTCGLSHTYGFGIKDTINLKTAAQYYNPNINGGKLWILKISSQTATGFQFYFSKFHIPNNAFLYIYSADTSSVLGPYSAYNNPIDSTKKIQFGTVPISGNVVYLEYFESDSVPFMGSIVIANIIHLFRGIEQTNSKSATIPAIGGSATCQQNAECYPDWDNEINSVAMVLAYQDYSNSGESFTGALINDVPNDGTPYFLTAAHAYGADYDPSTWEFLFNYQTTESDCNTVPSYIFYKTVNGAQVLSTDDLNSFEYPENSDYLLLQLYTSPAEVQSMGLCYSGWTTVSQSSAQYSDTYTLIHHPMADLKKISSGYDLINDDPNTGFTGGDFYDLSMAQDAEQEGGEPEHGSSGSPLYNAFGQIIGVTSGYALKIGSTYPEPCYPTNYLHNYFGRFDRDYLLGGFQQYLDPDNTGNTSVATICPVSTGGGGGGGSYSVSPISGGATINHKAPNSKGITSICPTDNLTFYPKTASNFEISTYTVKESCDYPNNSYCFQHSFLGVPYGSCYCDAYSYEVYISKLDYNLNPVEPVHEKVYQVILDESGGATYYTPGFSFPVPDVIGSSFIPGNFYNVGVGSLVNGTFYYTSNVVYIMPTSLVINNATNISTNVASMGDITLENTTVSNNINMTASNYINIEPNSTLTAGSYYIANNTCGSLLKPIKNTNSNYYTNRNASIEENINAVQVDKTESKNINIYPNPNGGSFTIDFTQ
ncbi:MAG TPA: hypothetical protein VNG53_07915, partial [Bacteroidia bacterium]|nr:hypothetical protein [Bacteroidia bacterium]